MTRYWVEEFRQALHSCHSLFPIAHKGELVSRARGVFAIAHLESRCGTLAYGTVLDADLSSSWPTAIGRTRYFLGRPPTTPVQLRNLGALTSGSWIPGPGDTEVYCADCIPAAKAPQSVQHLADIKGLVWYATPFRNYATPERMWLDHTRAVLHPDSASWLPVRIAAQEADWLEFSRELHARTYYTGAHADPEVCIQTHCSSVCLALYELDGISRPTLQPGHRALGLNVPEAVAEWQRVRGLKPDGVVGPRTWSRLIYAPGC